MPDKAAEIKRFEAERLIGCPDLSLSVGISKLTVNQPPHGFEGSSPSSPTNNFNMLAPKSRIPNRKKTQF
jgi:hypothetical protein